MSLPQITQLSLRWIAEWPQDCPVKTANYGDSNDEFDAVFFGSELEEKTEDSAHGSKRKGKRTRCESRIDCYKLSVFHVR